MITRVIHDRVVVRVRDLHLLLLHLLNGLLVLLKVLAVLGRLLKILGLNLVLLLGLELAGSGLFLLFLLLSGGRALCLGSWGLGDGLLVFGRGVVCIAQAQGPGQVGVNLGCL